MKTNESSIFTKNINLDCTKNFLEKKIPKTDMKSIKGLTLLLFMYVLIMSRNHRV